MLDICFYTRALLRYLTHLHDMQNDVLMQLSADLPKNPCQNTELCLSLDNC